MKHMMKWAGKSMALVIAFLVLTAGGLANAEYMAEFARTGQLEVRGQATRAVMPDTVAITIGATAQAKNEKDALNEVNVIIEKVIDSLLEMEVPENQIKTSRLEISPRYSGYSSSRKILGYTASVSLTVTIKDFDLINTVIDTSVLHGANNIGGMKFSFSDEELAYQQALTDAILVARERAESMARAAGVELGTLIVLRESGNYTFYRSNEYEAAPLADLAEEDVASQVMAGEIQISASVDLIYETR